MIPETKWKRWALIGIAILMASGSPLLETIGSTASAVIRSLQPAGLNQ